MNATTIHEFTLWGLPYWQWFLLMAFVVLLGGLSYMFATWFGSWLVAGIESTWRDVVRMVGPDELGADAGPAPRAPVAFPTSPEQAERIAKGHSVGVLLGQHRLDDLDTKRKPRNWLYDGGFDLLDPVTERRIAGAIIGGLSLVCIAVPAFLWYAADGLTPIWAVATVGLVVGAFLYFGPDGREKP